MTQRDVALHVRGSLAPLKKNDIVAPEKDEMKEEEEEEEEEEEDDDDDDDEEEEVWKKEWLASAKVSVEPGHAFSKVLFLFLT